MSRHQGLSLGGELWRKRRQRRLLVNVLPRPPRDRGSGPHWRSVRNLHKKDSHFNCFALMGFGNQIRADCRPAQCPWPLIEMTTGPHDRIQIWSLHCTRLMKVYGLLNLLVGHRSRAFITRGFWVPSISPCGEGIGPDSSIGSRPPVKSGRATYEIGVDALTGKVLENSKEGRHPD